MAGPSKSSVPLATQLIVVCMLLALLMPLLGATFITKQVQKEQTLTISLFGQAEGMTITSRADRWFRSWAVDTGLMHRVIHAMDKAENQQRAKLVASTAKPLVIHDSAGRFKAPNPNASSNPAGSGTASHLWEWWSTAVFALSYFSLLRISCLIALLPMLLPIVTAVLITGSASRKLKWHGFGGVSPLQYRAGIRLWGWMLGIGIGLIPAPGALPPVSVGICLLLSSIGVAMATANRQKPA